MCARKVLTSRPTFLAARCCVRLCYADLREELNGPVSTASSIRRSKSSPFAVTCSTDPLITDIWRTGSGQSKRFGEPLAVAGGDGTGRDGERHGIGHGGIHARPSGAWGVWVIRWW